jgi:hypothetical protein
MVGTASQIWRNWELDGVPSSGLHDPKLAEIRDWGSWLEGIVSAFTSNGGLIYTSRTTLYADLAHAANSQAWVIGDSTTAYNGVYQKLGASGAGSWQRVADLPYSFIKADIVGGTANVIEVTTFIPVSEQILVTFVLIAPTTATPATVSFNGDAALTIKTNTGFDPDVGALRAGMTLSGFKVGSEFRLLTDNVASALLSAMETLRDDTETQADRAETQANAAQASATEAAMYADMLNAAVYDFNFDSDPSTPGYDWNS